MVINKKKLLWIAKFVFTVFLFYLIYINIDWETLGRDLGKVKFELVTFALILAFLNIIVSAYKWWVLLHPFDPSMPYWHAARFYFIAFFLNNFLPGSIGGDAYRIYKVYKDCGSKSAAVIPIFIERLSGLFVLVLMGFVAGAYCFFVKGSELSLLSMLVGGAASAGILLISMLVLFKDRILKLELVAKRSAIQNKLRTVLDNILGYKQHSNVVIKAILITLLFYAQLFCARYLLIDAVGSEISMLDLISVIMLSNLLAMLPISINGYGVLDFSFVYLMSLCGVSYESAALVMLIHRCLLFLVSFFGGFLYLFSADRKIAGEVEV